MSVVSDLTQGWLKMALESAASPGSQLLSAALSPTPASALAHRGMGLVNTWAQKNADPTSYARADAGLKSLVSSGLQGNFASDQVAGVLTDTAKAALTSAVDGSLQKHVSEQVIRPSIDREITNTAWGLGGGALAGAGGGYLLHELTRKKKPMTDPERTEDNIKRLMWMLGSAGVGAGIGTGVNRFINPSKPGLLTTLVANQ